MMKSKIVIVALFFSGVSAFSQTEMTVEQCVKYGLENNANSKNAEIDQQIAKARVREITGIGLPQISAEGSYKNFIERPTSILPGVFFGQTDPIAVQFGTKFNVDGGVTASQLLFDGSYLVGLQAAKTYTELADKQLNQTRVEVAANIQKAYYSVLINKERALLLGNSVKQLEKTHAELVQMQKVGFIEKVDVDRTQVSLNNLKLQHTKVNRLEELSYTLLKFQMGMPIASNLTIAGTVKDLNVDELTEDKFAATDRPEYKVVEVQQRLAMLDLKNQKVKYAPSLVGFFNYNYTGQRDNFNFFDSDKPWFRMGLIGLTLSVPVFDGFQKHQKIQQSKLTLLKIENGINQLKNSIETEAASTKMMLQNSIDELKIQKQNQALAAEVQRISIGKYKAGVGSNLELISAESTKIESDNNYYNALYNAVISKIDFQKATGKLNY